MDDTVWWCASREDAVGTLALFSEHLRVERGLRLKEPAAIGRSIHGLRFCGFEVRPGAVWPGGRKRQRFAQGAQRLAAAVTQADAGDDWQRAHDALHATLAHTQSRALRLRVWARLHALREAD